MAESSNFCTKCGRGLEPGMQFCPQCGAVVSGSQADADFKKQEAEIESYIRESRVNWAVFALAIYAIPVTIAAFISLLDAGATANTIWMNDDFQNWIIQHDYDISVDTVKNYIMIAAGLALGSGVCALISMFCVIKRKMWKIAVAMCFLASVLCCWSIFGIFIGLMVTWMIYGLRDSFTDS